VSKETYCSVKRDLLQCQKRPTLSMALTHTRPITVSKETSCSVKRDLLQCQKRPTLSMELTHTQPHLCSKAREHSALTGNRFIATKHSAGKSVEPSVTANSEASRFFNSNGQLRVAVVIVHSASHMAGTGVVLMTCQKRPTRVKRDLPESKETYLDRGSLDHHHAANNSRQEACN
jgi:hypothetical protein